MRIARLCRGAARREQGRGTDNQSAKNGNFQNVVMTSNGNVPLRGGVPRGNPPCFARPL